MALGDTFGCRYHRKVAAVGPRNRPPTYETTALCGGRVKGKSAGGGCI